MPNRRPVAESLQEYARGVGGGLLFSLPLLYTAEVWATGASASPLRLLAVVVGTFGLLVAYNQTAGIRVDHTLGEVLVESVEEMGLGLTVAAGLLALFGRFPDDPFSPEALGLLTVAGMIAAVGVSVGTSQLGQPLGDSENDSDDSPEGEVDAQPAPRSAVVELAVALCGAVLVAANVAPTEEVFRLGTEMPPGALAGVVGLSLAVGGGILYASAFRGSEGLRGQAFGPVAGTLVSYAVALGASAALLWAVGFGDPTPLTTSVGPLVVLAFPGMIGASAGRLLLSPS